jgi:hypothetical protein
MAPKLESTRHQRRLVDANPADGVELRASAASQKVNNPSHQWHTRIIYGSVKRCGTGQTCCNYSNMRCQRCGEARCLGPRR